MNVADLAWLPHAAAIDWIKADPVGTIWNTHIQPPGLDLVRWMLPGADSPLSWWLFSGLVASYGGVALSVLMRQLGAGRRFANVSALIISIIPPVAALSYGAFYFVWVPAVMTGLAVFTFRLVRRGSEVRVADALFWSAHAAVLALSWAAFHIVWLAAVSIGVIFVCRRSKNYAALGILIVPLVLVVGLMTDHNSNK